MRTDAVIDFSTSSVSLLVAETAGRSTETQISARVQLQTKRKSGKQKLGEAERKEITEAAESMIRLAFENGAERVYAIASSTLSAINGFETLRDALEAKTGLKIYTLSAPEEADARLFANERYKILPDAVIVDFGSLSLKIYSFSNYMSTIPIGPLSLYGDLVSGTIPSAEEAEKIDAAIDDAFDAASLPSEGFFENAVLAGAYSQAIWQLYSGFFGLQHDHGEKILQYKKLKKLCKFLVKDKGRSIVILDSAPEMTTQIVPAAMLAKELLKRFGVENIVVSDLGVKEGFLKEILSQKRDARPLEKK